MITVTALENSSQPSVTTDSAFGCARDCWGHRFIYTVISPRARGLSIGVNMNPDKRCNFDCVYCEVNRSVPSRESVLEVGVMIEELESVLRLSHSGRLRERPCYQQVPAELLQLRHVTLSGDGEPTLCPQFVETLEAIIHLRSRGRLPFFKLVLITNASGLAREEVRQGLRCFTAADEIWAKLDAGTPAHLNQVNHPDCTLEVIESNILQLALRRPVIIQSLFPAVGGGGPPPSEVEAYVHRLKALKEAGARIPLVQIYSATRPTPHSNCGHLPLRTLSAIAQRVREVAGLRAEVF